MHPRAARHSYQHKDMHYLVWVDDIQQDTSINHTSLCSLTTYLDITPATVPPVEVHCGWAWCTAVAVATCAHHACARILFDATCCSGAGPIQPGVRERGTSIQALCDQECFMSSCVQLRLFCPRFLFWRSQTVSERHKTQCTKGS